MGDQMKNINITKLMNIRIISIIIILSMICLSCANNKDNPNNSSKILLETETIEINQMPDGSIYKQYYLGKIPEDSKDVRKDFVIVNNTEELIIINYAVTNCDCTIGTIEDEDGTTSGEFAKTSRSVADMELESNSSVTIHLNLDLTGEEPGSWIKILRVFDDYGDILLEIELQYDIVDV
jgi:hypothetical protein